MPSLNVAYILLHFPYLTETFVAEEIRAVRSQGVNVHIISVLQPGPGPVQPLSEQLLPYTWYAPGLLTPSLWKAQLHFLLKSPRLYLNLLVTLLRQPYPRQPPILLAKRLVIFLKAVAVAHHLRDSEVHLLHTHFASLSGAAAGICARLLDLPFTVTVHAFDIFCRLKNELLRLVTDQAEHVIAISEYNRQHLIATRICAPQTVSVVHCGVDLTKLPVQGQMREEERSETDSLRILSVGSLLPKKGHIHLIAACHLLQQQGVDFICNIIGSGENEAVLRRYIQEYDLQDRVQILKYKPHPEIVAAYRRHDLFVLASTIAPDEDRDGIPVVLMEAAAMGMPIISTRVSGIPELIHHGQTGWLVPPGDPAALADAIVTVTADAELGVNLGRNVRNLVKAEFDVEKNARRLATLFGDIHYRWLTRR